MKKISYLILTLFISLLITPIVFAKGNVEIKSIDLEDKSENVVVKSKPTFKGLEMNFDLGFKKQGDYAKYEVVIKNNSDKDFQISEDTSFNTSKYITYKYEVDKLLKAKGETTVHVTITYEHPISEELLANGKYNEQNKAIVQLQNEEGEAVNPDTRIGISLVVIVLFIASIVVAIILNKQYFTKYTSLFMILTIFLLPMFVFALETLKLTINVDVEIKKAYEVAYAFSGYVKESEKGNFDLSKADCRKTYYIGEKTNDNKYNYCFGIIKKDARLYASGEKVDLQKVGGIYKINVFNEETQTSFCEQQNDKEYLCSSETPVRKEENSYWEYSERISSFYGYVFKDSDFENMAFERIEITVEDENYIDVKAPQKFTMPSHNVIFEEVVPR